MPIIKALNPITKETIHSIQAVIVASALNPFGISLPPTGNHDLIIHLAAVLSIAHIAGFFEQNVDI